MRVLLHNGICQTRAVLMDGAGRPVRHFFSSVFDNRLSLGDVLPGNIAKSSPSDGGCFVRLEGKQEGFLAHKAASEMIEGSGHLFRVVAAARSDKLARLVLSNESEEAQAQQDPFERWLSGLPSQPDDIVEEGEVTAREIDAVFEDALSPIIGLERGGRLQISPTPALVAIDIDTIGRRDKGRASVRAKTVNIEAVATAARQLALRNLGGNVVIDCIGPLARTDGAAIKSAFVGAFRAVSGRKVSCLPPSPLGMMEAVTAHGRRPLYDTLHDEVTGELRPWAALLTQLREAERQASATPAELLTIDCPSSAYAVYAAHKKGVDEALHARFGGRISIRKSQSQPAKKIMP